MLIRAPFELAWTRSDATAGPERAHRANALSAPAEPPYLSDTSARDGPGVRHRFHDPFKRGVGHPGNGSTMRPDVRFRDGVCCSSVRCRTPGLATAPLRHPACRV